MVMNSPALNAARQLKNSNAYVDAHCAGFNDWACPKASSEVEQQAIDRGYLDGCKAREAALKGEA